MAALLMPVANCADLLVSETVKPGLGGCMEAATRHLKEMEDAAFKGKEMVAISDLLAAVKLLCHRFWPNSVDECDDLRLEVILRMLKMPQFNSKMNALKEVSRLIEESETAANANFKSFGSSRRQSTSGVSNVELVHISGERIVDWMGENKVLSVALEGNIDQVQYTDKIKGIVEFLGIR